MSTEGQLWKSKYKRSSPEGRKEHFFSIWMNNPDTKKRIYALAALEGRSASNYFNQHIAPRIEEVIALRWERISADTQKQALAYLEANDNIMNRRKSKKGGGGFNPPPGTGPNT